MPQWDKSNFESEATKIACAYRAGVHQNGSSINELATKVARQHNLTEEQIYRLVRATNVAMFDQEYGALKQAGAPDRIVEFDPGDPDAVIRELYKEATPPIEKAAAHSFYPNLTDQLAHHRKKYPQLSEKIASAEENLDAIKKALGQDPPVDRQIMRLQKVAEELNIRIKTAELVWNTTMGELDQYQRRVYFNRDRFEKNALALHSTEIVPELNVLRTRRRLQTLNIPSEKVAALQDRLVGETTKETDLLKQAATARTDFLTYREGKESVLTQLAELRKAMPRA